MLHIIKWDFPRCPFGLSTPLSQFQRYINTVFREMLRKNIIVFFKNDIITPFQGKIQEDEIKKTKKKCLMLPLCDISNFRHQFLKMPVSEKKSSNFSFLWRKEQYDLHPEQR